MDKHITDSFEIEKLFIVAQIPIGNISPSSRSSSFAKCFETGALASYWGAFVSTYYQGINSDRRIVSCLIRLNNATRLKLNKGNADYQYSMLFWDSEYKAIYDGGWISINNSTDGCFIFVPRKAKYYLMNCHLTANSAVTLDNIPLSMPLGDKQVELSGLKSDSKDCIINDDNYILDDVITLPEKTASRASRIVHLQHYTTTSGNKKITIGPFYVSGATTISACNIPNGMNCVVEVYDDWGLLYDYGAYTDVNITAAGYLLFTLSKSDSSSATIADVVEARNSFYAILE